MAGQKMKTQVLLFLTVTFIVKLVEAEVLEPPLFNIAQGKKIKASHTCGEDDTGYPLEELYCKLVGSSTDTAQGSTLVQGQFCDICDSSRDDKKHPADYAIDGSERWWQSPPLSRSMSMNEVNITIDLGQEFHVAYVIVRMGNSPRPGIWALERSADNGQTYKPWHYFADTTADCEAYFGRETLEPITRDDSVICDTQHSKLVPLEHGEVFIRLLDYRPSRHDFFSSDVLQEFTRTTNIRLRLLRTRTLLGHLMSVQNQDSTITRRYFYSIKDISIGGTCRCNGHADLCDYANRNQRERKLICVCQHNTCGDTCEYCCPGFVQRQWKAATRASPFVCEACNCHGHSRECYYDEAVDRNRTSLDIHGEYKGGGVCINCRHNTQGTNCNECRPGFFRPEGKFWNETDVCQPCRCNPQYHTGNCEEGTGICECRPQYKSPDCLGCSQGYYDYPVCKPCDCNFNGTIREICEVGGGECPCKPNFAGKNCDSCAENYYKFPECLRKSLPPFNTCRVSVICKAQCDCGNKFGGRQCDSCDRGYYDYPNCKYCDCDVRGTESGICDKNSGTCICREGYGGPRCDQCSSGFYGYPDCVPCNCSAVGSSTTSTCDVSGKCPCLINFSGRACDQCKPGYRKFPDCIPCGCDPSGTMGVSCDDEGKCQCKPNFDDLLCNRCKENFYNYPDCEECNCDPAGTKVTFQGCKNSPPGELCDCKERVTGRICNVCKPLYWNLRDYNPVGCDDCDCHLPGSLGGVKICESKTGQCECKPHVTSKRCDQCQDGFFNLNGTSLIGCEDCDCDPGGAETNRCNKVTGECDCRPRVQGKRCTEPKPEHYYPTLFQFQYEAEDGFSQSGGQVRFGYNDTLFPDYSWRGYAAYSQTHSETNHDVQIDKSSLYRVVFRYVNPSDEVIIGELTVAPEYSPTDIEQRAKVRFEPGNNFVTVNAGGIPTPYVLDPGRWRFTIKSDKYLLIDYFVLIPAAYYEGTILQKKVTKPCLAKPTDESVPCVELTYPIFNNYDTKAATSSYIANNGGKTIPSKRYTDKKVLSTLDVKELVLLSPEQDRLNFDLDITKSGRFVVVIEYFTPNGLATDARIQVDGSSKKGNASGEAVIYDCQYTVVCREAVVNQEGDIEIFRFDSPAKIVLTAPIDATGDIMINSVTAIPWSKWSMDHIRPKEFCVKKDGECIKTSFNLPPDSTKVEAETFNDDRIADMSTLPPEIGHRTKFVSLNSDDRSVDISGKVPKPAEYMFIVHYYQPNYPEFSTEVLIQNGQHYAARLPLAHCPSIEGCRAQIAQEDTNARFYIEDDFAITLTAPKDAWIDYILAVALPDDSRIRDYYRIPQRFLEHNRFEETARFISECGQNHMYLPPDTTGFCRDAVFSISVHYNNEALRCHCVHEGSHDFSCAVFGGQCNCKPNIIGRRCERCRTGFFGFPDCKPCDCPSNSLCDQNTGECICPKNVIGAKCDTCGPYTYGFDALIGCEDCACQVEGVRSRNLQCDLFNGTCTCRENVVGRACDSCLAGHWLFPECRFCGCDPRGTTDQICNQQTRECFCKQFVSPGFCDTCERGTFNLEERNPKGCTKCFCFAKTQTCSSSRLRLSQITVGKNDWSALTINPKESSFLTNVINHEIEVDDSAPDDALFVPVYMRGRSIPPANESQTLYFRAALNGNFLTSYGGLLNYNLISEPSNGGRDTFGAADVIIEGRELAPSENVIRLFHFTIDHLDGDHTMRMNLPIREENFLVESSGTAGLVSATRDQLMIALRGLTSIYIRGTYWKQTKEIRLASFNLGVAVESAFDPGDDRAVAVEECACPRSYIGLSCEECAPTYYRATSGPFGGHCVPCNCNRHADSCDPVSGICSSCRDNTRGDHCEKCEVGYHGDATQGTPYDCLICACPLPIVSNNFATSCEFSRDGSKVSCECKENYFGLLCESCNPGFYGSPETPGDYCKPCQCSGNIDMNDPSSCDTVTGACLRCMNNTGGPACNLCKRGYFGDALIAKDCQTCTCDKCGTQECNSYTGECSCLPHVMGVNCNRCESDYFGLSRCDETGCHPCHCGIASVTTQCHDLSGQCECKPGVTGRRCEHCAQGFWNYGPEGCTPCACNTEYAIGMGCDPQTGQCSCLPGVEGEKCERCPYRWVLTERGCHRCTSCQHQLLDETDRMAAILNPVKKDFDDVAVSYFTTQKMTYFNQTAADLEGSVALLDPTKENLKPYYTAVGELETRAKTYKQKAEATSESLKDKATTSLALRLRAVQVESGVQDAVVKARMAVAETKDLLEGLKAKETLSSPQAEVAIIDARAIIERMIGVRFDSTETDQEKELAGKVLEEVKEFVKPLQELGNELKTQSDGIVKARNKLRDIRNESDYSIGTSFKARDIITKIKEARYPAKIALLESRAKEMQTNIDSAVALNEKLPPAVQDLNRTSNELDRVLASVRELKDRQEQSASTLINELSNNKDTLYISHEHARALKRQADSLARMFDGSKRTSEQAFSAATAYQNIVDALEEAERLANNAKNAAVNATDIIDGLEQAASQALEPSRNLRVLSDESVSQVDDKLKIPLRDAKLLIDDITKITDRTNNSLNNIGDQLDRANVAAPAADLNRANQKSSDAIDKALKTLESISGVVVKLPNDEALAKQLPITVTDLNKGVEVSSNQLRGAKDSIPLSIAITENLEQKRPLFDQRKEEIGNLLGELKARIASARELASRIKVGMNFNESSTLVAANPQSLDAQQVRTEMSFFFKTKDPYGLLLFLGNEPGRRPENDFIAIEVDGGYPVLTLDLGSGQQRFIIHDKYVADDKWYKAGVDRHGRRVKFTISEETSEGRPIEYASSDYYRQGTKSLLNVDRNSSKLFVGGFPDGEFRNPVRHSSYRGIIEDLRIGGQRVGLWNFDDAHHVFPAEERDRFLNLRPERGLRFLGNGYAIMSSRQYRFAQESAVRLSFRTRAQNGLLFLAGRGKKFMSLEIVNGRVVFQYNLGSGTATITSPEVYTDGRWHKIDAVRDKDEGMLRINDGPPRQVRSPPPADSLATTDYMYFGGYPGKHEFPEVTNKDFDGCIDNVMIETAAVDLTGATDTRDTMVGCPPTQVEQVATFYGDGYLKVPVGETSSDGPIVSRPSDEQFELNFRFRSNATNGLIFYGSDPNHDNYVSVSLENGALHVIEKGGTKVKTQQLNDANWHVVTVTRDRTKLTVNVDDAEDITKDAPGGPVILSQQGSVLLFGGHPAEYPIPSHNAASTSAFQGCLTDINYNGKRVTFGDSESVGTSVSQNCFTGENRPESIISPTISSREDGEEEPPRPIPTRRTTTTTQSSKIPVDEDEFPDIIFEPDEPTTTTTRKPKTLDEPTPTPFQQCALPLRTKIPLDDSVTLQEGIRFGNFEKTSRLEFQEPQTDGSSAEYSIEFKTTSPNGLILMKTNRVSNDFIALYLLGGSVHFAFDPGSSMALLNSSAGFNDGRWHSVTVSQQYKDGTLKIDGREIARGSSGGQTREINAGIILFVGGLSEEVWTSRDTTKKLQGMNSPFKGCLRNLWSKNVGGALPEPHVKHSIEPCTDEVEPGYYFYPNSGYMTIGNNFRVFQRFKISLKIKPRTPTGLILAVHGRRDYLVLQMINGTIKFTVDNGKGALSSSFTKDQYDLCDGQWHTIQAGKTKNVVTLSVDNTFALPGIGSAGTTWTDTNNPLYFGGHPSPHTKTSIETTDQFVGCIKDLTIEGNKTALSFSYDTIFGSVAQHSCPTD